MSDTGAGPLTPWGVRDVAGALGVGRTTVYALCKAGKLRHARVERAYRFRREWVEEYLRGVTAGGAAGADPAPANGHLDTPAA